jgi:hypothetical protein
MHDRYPIWCYVDVRDGMARIRVRNGNYIWVRKYRREVCVVAVRDIALRKPPYTEFTALIFQVTLL